MPAATSVVFSGNAGGWLTQVAIQIQDGGAKPPSRADLLRWVPEKVGTARNDGHVTAHENGFDRKDYRKGYEIWVDGAVQALRDADLIEGDETLSWKAPADGTWKVPFADRNYSVYGKAERAEHQAKHEMEFLLRGYSDIVVDVETHSRGQTHIRPRTLSTHPLALAIPPMTEAEQRLLREDIADEGVTVPVVLFADENEKTPRGKPIEKILDGRHRAYFASVLGKPIKLERFEGTEVQARRRVASLNLKRRHLTSQQIALSIVKLFGEPAKAEAREDRTRKPADSVPGHSQEQGEAKYDQEWPARAIKMAGSPPGVTPDTVRAVAPAAEPGMEDVAEKIESGEIKSTVGVTKAVKEKKGQTTKGGKGSVGNNITAPRSALRRMGEARGQLLVIRQEWDEEPEKTARIERSPKQWKEMLDRADEIIEIVTWLRGEIAKGAGPGF